jgi:acyl-[acyl carrier protein]--UDP-N-acetylglucosamine O-acyltransferase
MTTAAALSRLQSFALEPGLYDDQAAEWMAKIPHDSPVENADFVRAQVKAGHAHIANIVQAGGRVGVIVYSVEDGEFILVAGYSLAADPITPALVPAVEKLAAALHCNRVRFHTIRRPIVQAAQAAGYYVSEIVLRKTLSPHV